jgi:hypothetical protein
VCPHQTCTLFPPHCSLFQAEIRNDFQRIESSAALATSFSSSCPSKCSPCTCAGAGGERGRARKEEGGSGSRKQSRTSRESLSTAIDDKDQIMPFHLDFPTFRSLFFALAGSESCKPTQLCYRSLHDRPTCLALILVFTV